MLFIAFLVYVILLVLRPHEFMPQLQQVPILQIVLLTATGFWAVTPGRALSQPQFRLLIPFLLVVWIGMGLNGWWGGIVKALDQLLPPILLFVIASGAVRSIRQLRIFMVVLVVCACMMVLHGHLQLRDGVGWTGSLPIEGRITYSGIFNDPNDLGLLLVICLAIALYLLGLVKSFLLRATLAAVIGWLGYGVYLTNSRGTMLATGVVLGYFLWRNYGKRAVIVTAAIAVPVLFATTRLAQLDAEDESAEGRLDAWYVGLEMLLGNPLFGVGYSNFSDHHYLTAHNSLVLAMAELGLFGYLIWFAFVGYSGYMLHWLAFRCEEWLKASGRDAPAGLQEELAAARALFAACIGFATGAFFLSQSYKYMLFLMCGLAVGRYQQVLGLAGPFPQLGFLRQFRMWAILAAGSIIGLYVFLKFSL